MKHLLKHEYPNIKKADYIKALNFIKGKCSQYYFLDYMRCTNGDVDDAIEFYLLDDELRSLFSKYLIRFEIQIKTDFVYCVQEATHCSSFWKKRKFYIYEARRPGKNGKVSNYTRMKRRIQENINRATILSIGPSNYVAMYFSSFGIFQELFKLIDTPHKNNFINLYTNSLSIHDYRTLNGFLEAIRKIRNRCAHGNHIITLKMVNDLNSLRTTITSPKIRAGFKYHLTVMESVIIFVIRHLNCGEELKNKLISILTKHNIIIVKYSGKHSLSANTVAKII